MIKGGRALTVAGCVAAAACAQTQSVKVRPITDPAKKESSGGGLLADARAQLALGDVGIALETFQTLARQQPENADAYSGIAACYEAMGRFDIARQNYELALAYAPNDPALLLKLAGSLDQLGATDQASQVRAEAARLQMPPAAPVAVTPVAVKQLSSVTVKLPAPVAITPAKARQTADIGPPVTVQKPNARASGSHAVISARAPSPATVKPSLALRNSAPSSAPVLVAEATIPEVGKPALVAPTFSSAPTAPKATRSAGPANVAITLPLRELLANARGTSPAISAAPPKSVDPFPAGPTVEIALRRPNKELPMAIPPARPGHPDRPPVAAIAQVNPRVENGPRLRRESQSEVSLITTPQPVRYAVLARPALSSAPKIRTEVAMNVRPILPTDTLKWVPLKYASTTDNIQLLNAARSQSLAAHVRLTLLNRGWRKIGIGNSPLVRQHSLVLYSPARVRPARRLAAQFHCKAVQTRGIKSVLVLLGRDAALARRSTERA